jgi:DNA polymerase elongation subunit (family B)
MWSILNSMKNYDTLAGYGIFSDRDFVSDIDHITDNCNKVGLSNRFSRIKSRIEFLDAAKIFKNRTVKGFLKAADKIDYREENLDSVAKAYVGKGKLEGISGIFVETLTPDKQLDYCLQDACLCYELLQKKNFELLSILSEIGNEVGLSFFDTCNAGYSTAWWEPKLKSINFQEPSSEIQRWIKENMTYDKKGKKTGVKYLGGYVVEPKLGRHFGAVSYDVSSMYPTMIDKHNISIETVNCDCCYNNPKAYIPNEVMLNINNYLTGKDSKARNKESRSKHYWICQKRRGQLSVVMADLIKQKIEYKIQGQKLKEKAIKILMNSGYGCFGSPYFLYQDPRVAELITAFGQYTLKHLEDFAGGEEKVLYGDTDSIYFVSENNDIIVEAQRACGAKLEIDKRWKVLFLTTNKKQYFGITENGEIVHTTLPGMKNDQPAYFDKVMNKLISREFLESFISSEGNPLNAVSDSDSLSHN